MMSNNTSDIHGEAASSAMFGVMTAAQFHVLLKVLQGPFMVICIFGIIGNSLNVAIFRKMGLKDSVTLSFYIQSLYDLCTLTTEVIHVISALLWIIVLDFKIYFRVDPFMISCILANTRDLFYTSSILTTTFLAVARCLCVYKPLKFKMILTTMRTYCILTSFFLISVIIHGPTFLTIRVVDEFNSLYSKTQFRLHLTSWYETFNNVEDIIGHSVVNVSTFLVVLMSLFIMKRSLVVSAKFRSQNVGHSTTETTPVGKVTSLGGKELQALRQVYVVCLIFVICNAPKIIIAMCSTFIPVFQLDGVYHYTVMSCYSVRVATESIGVSSNFLVYAKFNSKFGATLMHSGRKKKIGAEPQNSASIMKITERTLRNVS